eukprot:TRINITY_DN2151_c0_g3_i1.p1 TRINITY_DN2151_c0_g3~~TRINITY_DN2151_c0_g3_i1.p1  ORF type:complete len:364 (+),score=87.29 TRINITY_DN2151_c0_g3_i1:46-1092(+)
MSASCIRRLQNMFKELQSEPVEGLLCEIPDESNMLEWNIWMEGPPDSPYANGVFKLHMSFPHEFPMEPPELKFDSDFWHPNVYKDGKVCISILHAPGEDALSGELPEERWLPTQTVATVMLSVVSMLSDPNISSPANLDASLEWRNERPKYLERCKRLVEKANREKPDHVKIPHPESDPAEKAKRMQKHKLLMDDDFMMDSDDGFAFESDDDAGSFDYYDDEAVSSEESEDTPPKKSKSKSEKDATKKSDAKQAKEKKKSSDAKSSSKKPDSKTKADKEKSKDKSKEKSKSKSKEPEKAKEKEKGKEKEKEKEKKKEKSKKSKEDKKSQKSDKLRSSGSQSKDSGKVK